MTAFIEINYDSIIGPSHHYGGLSQGNIASQQNLGLISHPKKAALQGLKKMLSLSQQGLVQGFLPPHPRPHMAYLRSQGFQGSRQAVITAANQNNRHALNISYSASYMWLANAATISPSPDTKDGKIHITPANLLSHQHRAIETTFTAKLLQYAFPEGSHFTHHAPLPQDTRYADEGAANYSRICQQHGEPGLSLFVYGSSDSQQLIKPQHFKARQTLEAATHIARTHQLDSHKVVFAQQQPQAIDAGVFHNDIVCLANRHIILIHEKALVNQQAIYQEIQDKLPTVNLQFIEVSDRQVPLQDAITSYLFNSQLIDLPHGEMALIYPKEVVETLSTHDYLQQLLADDRNPINHGIMVDCRESMLNGGGPACLRFRMVVSREQLSSLNPLLILNEDNYAILHEWINTYFREQLSLADLACPTFAAECELALDKLTQLLQLGPLYPFQ